MSRLRVRRAQIEDHDRLAEIYRRASLSNAGDRADLQAHPKALVLSDEVVKRGRARVATLVDGQVVGFASTHPTDQGVLELDDLFVDPFWQRRGAGRALLCALAREALSDGVTRLEVTANDHAFEFYRAVGFVTDGRIRTQFGAGARMHLDIGSTSRGSSPSA